MSNKKCFLTFFLLISCLAFVVFVYPRQKKEPKTVTYVIKGQNYTLLIADEEQEWKQGLMNYRRLNGADGMIFVFPKKDYRSFWNKNTFLNLQIYWISDDKIIGNDYLPSIEKDRKIITTSSPQPVNKVIELVVK